MYADALRVRTSADFLRRTIHRVSGSNNGGASLDGAPTAAQRGAPTRGLGGALLAAPKPLDAAAALAPQNGHDGAGAADSSAAARRPARRRAIPLRVNGAAVVNVAEPLVATEASAARDTAGEGPGGADVGVDACSGDSAEGLGGLLAAGAQRVSRRRKAVSFDLCPLGVDGGGGGDDL